MASKVVEEMNHLLDRDEPKTAAPGCCAKLPCFVKALLVILICVPVLILVAYFGLRIYLASHAKAQMLTINAEDANWGIENNIAEAVSKMWWPGCDYVTSIDDITKKCADPCYDPAILHEMWVFNKNNPGQLVSYPSREDTTGRHTFETIQLKGWWLPAVGGFQEPRPRIVIQHGFTENSNFFRPQLAAYMLRKMGFDVLLNNFRDHGYSGNSSVRIYQWGNAYPLDLLGAWDYARKDPDGKLGGTLPDNKVGLMGFSKGAFVTLQSFGIEGKVPGAWVDAPPFEPKTVFSHGAKGVLEGMGLGWAVSLGVVDSAWQAVEDAALSKGVDLNYHKTTDSLSKGPNTKRPIYTVANSKDGTVPFSEHESLVALLGDMPEKYDLKGKWVNSGQCHGMSHCVDHLTEYAEYTKRLCGFWTKVFQISSSACES